jgi:hypothetical protein
MTFKQNNENWIIIGNSVKGASHIRSGKPNQDRIKFHNNNSTKFPIIVAISDGHGGKPYFRSGTGAQLAVESAIEIGKCLTEVSFDTIKDKKNIDWICRDIVKKWLEKVNQDLQISPFNEEETSLLITKKESGTKRPVGPNNNDSIIAYGSTLIAAFILDSYILFLQLGDGDVMIASNDGVICKPIPKDSRLIGVETTSLCLPEAWTDFRFYHIPLNDTNPPALIILSTDGYGNSYSSEHEFEKIGIDLLEIICEHPDGIHAGIDSINSNLNDWLNVASEKGSGDDITVGIICNMDQIEVYRDTAYSLKKQKNLEEENPKEKSSLDKEEILPSEIPINPDNASKDIAEKTSESSDSIIDQL